MAKQGNQSSSGDSGSPLSARRGNADPTDVDPSPVQTNTGMFDFDKNTLQPSGPIEPGGATPPKEAPGAGER
jgi:hypothetical protein